MAHVIRLRGPWQCEVQASDAPTSVVVQVPCDLAQVFEPGFQGTVRFSRRFNRTTGLNAGAPVRLVLENELEIVKVVLNGQLIGQSVPQSGSIKLEIADHILPHNLLMVEAKVNRDSAGRFSGARIEIDASA